jgi:hypothetical protein
MTVAGCGAETNPEEQADATVDRGGTLTVGAETWTIVPAIQCSVFPGNVISIAGHAAEDPSLEIVIDYGGPTGVRIGDEGTGTSWFGVRDTIQVDIDGKTIRGTATFSDSSSGTGESQPGSFEVNC